VTGVQTCALPISLIVDFFDRDHNAAILLNQILYWTSRTNDPDGWFHKTYNQWRDELRFSTYQIMRVVRGDDRVQKEKRTLWSIGLETQVRMAPNGRNAVHYRLNIPAFMTAFTEWLVETYGIVLGNKARKTMPARRQPTSKKLNLFVRYKSNFGIATKKQRRAILKQQHHLGLTRTHEIVADCVDRVRDWTGVLRTLEEAVLEQITRPETPPVQVEPQPYRFENLQETALPTAKELSQTQRDEWQHIANMLRQHMRSDYDDLLHGNQLVDHTTDSDDETFIVAVRDTHAAETLNGRWSRFVRSYATDALGRSVHLVFVPREKWVRQQE